MSPNDDISNMRSLISLNNDNESLTDNKIVNVKKLANGVVVTDANSLEISVRKVSVQDNSLMTQNSRSPRLYDLIGIGK